MTHRRTGTWMAVLAALLLVVAGCGDDDDGIDASQASSTTVVESTAVVAAEVAGVVLATTDLIDTAGFHDMAEDLATATEINPRYQGSVENALTAMAATAWPDDLVVTADEFATTLASLHDALASGGVEAAAAAAESVHDAQHDFSHGVYAWLSDVSGDEVSPAAVLATIDLVDTAGFHDMAKDLATASEINPRYEGRVGNVVTTMRVTAWPTDMQVAAAELDEALSMLEQALADDDLAAAAPAAEQVHDAQHDFSQGVYGWMAGYEGGGSSTLGPHQGPAMIGLHLKQVDMMDSLGFHDMAEALATATESNPRDAGRVENLITTFEVGAWPPELQGTIQAFVAELETLVAALTASDLETAATAAEAVHEVQHDVSHDFYGWLATS